MTEIKTAQAWGALTPDGRVYPLAISTKDGRYKQQIVIVHGLTEAEVHEAAALRSACRELGIETVEQLKAKTKPDPRVAVLESICEFLARPITIPTYLSARVREYYILDVTEYRSQILKLIAAQRGEVEK